MRRTAIAIVTAADVAGGAATGAESEAPSADAFTLSVTIARPAAPVWRALTREAGVDRYYLAPLGADITGTDGEVYCVSAERRLITGQIVTFRESVELAHTFRFVDGAGAPNSLVRYRLSDTAGMTVLSVEHIGFDPGIQNFGDTAAGWPIIFEGLRAYLEGTAHSAD